MRSGNHCIDHAIRHGIGSATDEDELNESEGDLVGDGEFPQVWVSPGPEPKEHEDPAEHQEANHSPSLNLLRR
jgi:hypothetical protein